MSGNELDHVVSTVDRWVRAVWHDHDTAAAVALMHPDAMRHWPAEDVGDVLRHRFPWLGDPSATFSQPFPVESAPDMVVVEAETDLHSPARIVVILRPRLGTGQPDLALIMDVVSMNECN
ncbi:MAG TPA: hypothetical protein VGH99_13835 [Pseudonocardia sp.]|jgi:hypothetical protein